MLNTKLNLNINLDFYVFFKLFYFFLLKSSDSFLLRDCEEDELEEPEDDDADPEADAAAAQREVHGLHEGLDGAGQHVAVGDVITKRGSAEESINRRQHRCFSLQSLSEREE